MFQKIKEPAAPATEVDPPEEYDLGAFSLRTIYNFDEDTIRGQSRYEIVIVPDEPVLLHRVVMHHSIARHLRLLGITVGNQSLPGRPKSGTCEIFYAEVPNWTPQGIVFTPKSPLKIHVRNENEKLWLLTGTVVALRMGKKTASIPSATVSDEEG